MILYAVALHLIWAIAGIHDHSAYNSTALAAIFRMFQDATPVILIIVAVLAFIAVELRQTAVVTFALILPQQTVLIISAFGSLHAMIAGHYADGIERSQAFIVADQVPAILAALGHTAAIIQFVLREARIR